MDLAGLVDRVTTSLSSPRVLATLAGVGLVVLLAGYAARRRGASLLVAAGVAAVPAVIAGVVLVTPYFRTRTANEALPGADGSGAAPSASSSLPAGTAPVRLAAAPLRGLGGHRASGTVALYRLADGRRVARFESVDIEGTPTPYVYLVPGRDRERPGGTKAGRLTAEKGSFHYALPEGLAGELTVLVWCERFAVPIAGASLA